MRVLFVITIFLITCLENLSAQFSKVNYDKESKLIENSYNSKGSSYFDFSNSLSTIVGSENLINIGGDNFVRVHNVEEECFGFSLENSKSNVLLNFKGFDNGFQNPVVLKSHNLLLLIAQELQNNSANVMLYNRETNTVVYEKKIEFDYTISNGLLLGNTIILLSNSSMKAEFFLTSYSLDFEERSTIKYEGRCRGNEIFCSKLSKQISFIAQSKLTTIKVNNDILDKSDFKEYKIENIDSFKGCLIEPFFHGDKAFLFSKNNKTKELSIKYSSISISGINAVIKVNLDTSVFHDSELNRFYLKNNQNIEVYEY